MAGLVAVHVGAGYHSESKRKAYKALCKQVCKATSDLLKQKVPAVDAVSEAVTILEDSALTNAGIGSNLTLDGTVECDAGVMDGHSLNFGSVGAVYGLKNPVKVAEAVLKDQFNGLSLGRIPPCMLVGKGAVQWASKHGFDYVDSNSLITKQSQQSYSKYLSLLQSSDFSSNSSNSHHENLQLDTVGAVCVDRFGTVASAVSSGGLLLKHPGRVGQAAIYGAGCWAHNNAGSDYNRNIAVTVTGVGEFLIKTSFARECCNSLSNSDDSLNALPNVFRTHLLESPFLRNEATKPAGALAVTHFSEEGISELSWAHTTKTFMLGYMSVFEDKPHCVLSELPCAAVPGVSVTSSGKVLRSK